MDKGSNLDNIEFSIVIPAFNEEQSLPLLQERLYKVMEKLPGDYEIIYVDDGSKDTTLEVLKKLKEGCPKIRIISFKENRGKSVAFFAGFKACYGKWIITLDADLQNPPEEIFKLLKLREDFDFITGIREKRKDSFLKRISSEIARVSSWLVLGDTTKDIGCCLRMFKREIVDYPFYFRNFHRFFPFLVKLYGFSVKEVYVAHSPRRFGKSKYGILKRAKEGIFDLAGVLWYKKRYIKYEVKYKC